jgi:hypothetical protein
MHMAKNPETEAILRRLLEAASATWGEAKAQEMRSAFETAAEAIGVVEGFPLPRMEEPAHLPTIFSYESWRRASKTGGK